MMLAPETRKIAKQELFEGMGCCAPLMPWRDNVRNRDAEADRAPHGKDSPSSEPDGG